MKQNNIYLVGFMGSGKTSILKKIKQIVNVNTIDLDENIEKKYGSINKIFQTKGEKYFRNIELKTFEALPVNDCVIALGGGAFLSRDIKKEVLKNHLSFWLSWESKTLINRINNSKNRPLAFRSSKNEILQIIKKRSLIYSKALYKIDCDNNTKQEIAKKIISIYEAN